MKLEIFLNRADACNAMEKLLTNAFFALIMSGAVSTVAMVVTKAGIMSKFRNWIDDRSKFLGELVACPFCFSFYVMLPLQCIYKINLIQRVPILDEVVSYFFMIAICSFFCGWIYKSISKIA